MQGSILIQTFSGLTPAERKELQLFLHCPLYNGGKHAKPILALFTLLENEIHKKNQTELDKNRVHEALFPGKSYQQGYFENLMSELMKLMRQFLVQREIRLGWSVAFESLVMARFYRERGLPERAKQAINRAKSDLSNTAADLSDRRLLAFWLEQEISVQECLNNQRKGDLNVPGALHALTVFYGHKLLELVAVFQQQQRVVPELQWDWDPFIEQFRETLRGNKHFDDPAIFMLDEALKLLKTKPENPKQTLEEFLQLFKTLEAALPPALQKILAAYSRNFCVQHGNAMDNTFRLGLYREHLEKGWLYEQGKLQPTSFLNLVNISLNAGETDWLWAFLQEHQGKIDGEQTGHLVLYSYARYYFQQGQWEKVEDGILEISKLPKFSDIGLEKLVRILEIKTGYELDPFSDRLENALNNFTMLIQRSKRVLVEKHRVMDKNFIAAVRRMIRFREQINLRKPDLKGLQKMFARVEDHTFQLAERGWLREKLNSLREMLGLGQKRS